MLDKPLAQLVQIADILVEIAPPSIATINSISPIPLKRASHRSRFRQRCRCVGRYDYVRVFTPKKCGLAVTVRKRFSWFFRHYVEIKNIYLNVMTKEKRTDFELCEWANCSASVGLLVVA